MDYSLDAIQLAFEPGRLLALNVILALLMFGVALDLRIEDFRAVLRSPKVPLVGIATQLLLLPPATFLLVQIIDPIPSVKLGMMLVAACPGGNVSNFLVWMARGNTALSVSMTAVTSSAAVFTTPFNLAFWASMDPDTRALLADVAVDAGDMFITIFLLLGVPLVAGMLFRTHYPALSARIQRPLRMTDGAISSALSWLPSTATGTISLGPFSRYWSSWSSTMPWRWAWGTRRRGVCNCRPGTAAPSPWRWVCRTAAWGWP